VQTGYHPVDVLVRKARKENNQWVIPIQTQDRGMVEMVVRSYDDLKGLLKAMGEQSVIRPYIGGSNIQDEHLSDKGTKAARKRARRLLNAFIDRYAPLIATDLGIPVPREGLSVIFGGTTSRLLKTGIKGASKSITGLLKEGQEFVEERMKGDVDF